MVDLILSYQCRGGGWHWVAIAVAPKMKLWVTLLCDNSLFYWYSSAYVFDSASLVLTEAAKNAVDDLAYYFKWKFGDQSFALTPEPVVV